MIIIGLAACSTTPQTIQVTSKPIDKPELVLPNVDQINMRKIDWVVINAENMEEKLAEITAGGAPLGIFVLTAQGYENLGLNFSDIRALVQQQQQIILAYENYYKEANKALEEAEAQRQAEEAADAAKASEESKGIDLNPFD
jgi:regulator of protease activity HflC (stomatin/prohibitin superfamily)